MFKRSNKMAALLVAAASVISLVPANAAEVQKIEAQEGTIYNATAKGKCIYLDGEINYKEEAQYWISEDGKYNVIDGLDEGDAAQELLLNKYLEIDEDTYVDITDNYKVLDDSIKSDLEDDAATTLRKKIKNDNDGRFDESYYASGPVDATIEGTNKFLSCGSGLALYKYKLKDTRVNGEQYSAIYSDYQGNYIDADYNLGNIKITTTGDSVTLKNTEDTYEITTEDGTTYELKATIKENKEIADISDYIYRWADLTIVQRVKDSISWNDLDQNLFGFGAKGYTLTTNGPSGSNTHKSIRVLQKFSKTPATDDIDGIKYSKDSAIYFIADEDGNSEYILGKSDSDAQNKVGAAGSGKPKIAGNAQGFVSAYLDSTNKKIYAEKLTLKSKEGFNYVDLGDYDSTDTNYTDKLLTPGGTVWALDGGYIKTWDGDESFTKLYKVDGSMNNIAVSSKDNVIVWNEDDGFYSIIHNVAKEGAKAGAGTGKTATTTASGAAIATAGWVQATNGTWTCNKADGTKATGWLKDGSAWYYLKADGVMATGWMKDGSNWYYLKTNGAMATGWIKDGLTWYYLNESGAMLSNTTVDGYVLGASGAMIG